VESTLATGVQVSNASDVFLADLSETGAAPLGNEILSHGSGVHIEGAERVSVFGTRIGDPAAELGGKGIWLVGACGRISIGVPPGLDSRTTAINVVRNQADAVFLGEGRSDGAAPFGGTLLIRGGIFEGNQRALFATNMTSGAVEWHHNTVRENSSLAVKFEPWIAGHFDARFFNSSLSLTQEAYAQSLPHFALLADETSFGAVAGGIFLQQVDSEDRQYLPEGAIHPDSGNDPMLDQEGRPLDGSPLVDSAVQAAVEFWTDHLVSLDQNGAGDGLFCKGAPDVGALELCR
jgi:hypothetical protein